MASSSRRGPILDRNNHTTPSGGRQLDAHTISSGLEFDGYRDKLRFTVAVLSKPIPMSTKDTVAVLGGDDTIDQGETQGQIAFKGRIQDADVLYGMHDPLPNPGTLDWGADQQTTAKLISLHTTFISQGGYVGKRPEVGDYVTVTMNYGDFSYNLQYAYFDSMVAGTSPMDKSKSPKFEKLRTKFNNFKAQRGGTVGKLTVPAASGKSPPGTGAPAGTSTSGVTCRVVSTTPKTATQIHAAYPLCSLALAEKIVEVAGNLGIPDPGWLANLINFESGESFKASTTNSLGYVGLIQFGKGAATDLGTTRENLKALSEVQQMDWAEKYFQLPHKRQGASYKDPREIYMAVFYPSYMGDWGKRFPEKVVKANSYGKNIIDTPTAYTVMANRKAKLETGLSCT